MINYPSNTTGSQTRDDVEDSAFVRRSVRLAGSHFETPEIANGVHDYPGGAPHEYMADSYRPQSTFGHQGATQILTLPSADGPTPFAVQRSNGTTQLRRCSSLSVADGPLSPPDSSGGSLQAQSFDIPTSFTYTPFSSAFPEADTPYSHYDHSFNHFHDHDRYIQTCGLNSGGRLNNMDEAGHLDAVPESDTTSSDSVPSYSALATTSATEQAMTAAPSSTTNTRLHNHRDRDRENQSLGREQPLPFNATEMEQDIVCDSKKVQIHIDARCPKNVFNVDGVWTCYRRNYIAVESSFNLNPMIPNGRLYLPANNNNPRRIQAFAIRLDAKCDGADGKEIELVQHTAKRDKGEKTVVEMKKLAPNVRGNTDSGFIAPTSSPDLPLQCEEDFAESSRSSLGPASAVSSPQTAHTFERIQFKNATANNGRRRAQQQYYHLVVSLWADVRASAQSAPDWVKVAYRVSEPMVVRGRSPGHYTDSRASHDQNNGLGGAGGSGAPGGSGSHPVSRPERSESKTSRHANSSSTIFNNDMGHGGYSYQANIEYLRPSKDRFMDGLEHQYSPLLEFEQNGEMDFWDQGSIRMGDGNSRSWSSNSSAPISKMAAGKGKMKVESDEGHEDHISRRTSSNNSCADGSWLPGRYARLAGSKRSRSRSKDVLDSFRLCLQSSLV